VKLEGRSTIGEDFYFKKALQCECDHNVLEKQGKIVYIFKETVLFYFEIR